MKRIRRLLFRGKFFSVLLETGLGAVAALLLVFSVVRDIPPTNVAATFFFLMQAPVLWGALRLSPSTHKQPWVVLLREVLFALFLRALVYGMASGLTALNHAEDLIGRGFFESMLNLVVYTASFSTFLIYRLVFFGFERWRRLTQRSLLWTLVNSHLIVVFTLVALFSLGMRLTSSGSSIDKFVPPNLVANLVLELVRGLIPWLGVSLILILASEAVFLPPTILVSYLISRRFVRRIDALAGAMGRAREGDLNGARVEPAGEDEIARLQANFNHMAAQLQQEREKVDRLLKNQRELAAVVSHELRTPITVMRAYLENNLLEEKAARLPEEVTRDLDTVHHEILSLQALVEDLFTLSRLEAQALDLECAWIDPAAAIQRVIEAHQPLAWKNKRIDLSTHLPLALPPVWGDARRLEQVLGNLAQNAIRHTPDGGVVMLTAETGGRWLEISVIDSGEGISAEDLPHVWERFYRGGHGGGAAGRTGIGLSLVKDLVEAMDGSVGVESRQGADAGSRFWLRLHAQTGPA